MTFPHNSHDHELSTRSDRPRIRRRAQMHPLMEAFITDMAAKGRPHVREKASRLDPLTQWCQQRSVDPAQASAEDLSAFRAWVLADWRLPDGGDPTHHTKRHTVGMTRAWYRWLAQAGHRDADVGRQALSLATTGPSPTARYAHTPLHPLMQAYVEHHGLRGRPGTASAQELALRQFSTWCRDNRIEPLRLTRQQADAYLVWISATAVTPSGHSLARGTIAQRIANLKSWYEWMEIRGDIVASPAAKLRVRVVESRVVVHQHLSLQEAIALVQAQAQAVLDAPSGTFTWARRMRTLAAICIALATGRRIAGLLHIQIDDLDCERRELRVEREKGRIGRVLPVAEWAVAMVRSYLAEARPLLAVGISPWVFVGHNGSEPLTFDAASGALDEVMRLTIAANPDLEELPAKRITWHSLRVSFATMLFSNGCPIRSVNELMLHRCLSTTAKYTPIPIEDLHKVWKSAHPRP